MKLIDKLSYEARIELLKEAGVFDSIEDLQRSLHLMSLDDLQKLEEKIQNVIKEHNETVGKKVVPYEQTPLEEFEFADDAALFASIADAFDKQGCFEAADIIESLATHLVKKSLEPGRAQAKSIRKMKRK